MYRDKVPFNKAGKVSHEKDTFAQKDSFPAQWDPKLGIHVT